MKTAIITMILAMALTGCAIDQEPPSFHEKAKVWQRRESLVEDTTPIEVAKHPWNNAYVVVKNIIGNSPPITYDAFFERYDYWRTSQEFIDNNYHGDCEDISIYIYSLIRASGLFDDDDVWLRLIGNPQNKYLHVILAIDTLDGPLYVDNQYVRHKTYDDTAYNQILMEWNLFAINY